MGNCAIRLGAPQSYFYNPPSEQPAAHDYFILHEPPWRVIGFCVHTRRPFLLCILYIMLLCPRGAKDAGNAFEERGKRSELLAVGMLAHATCSRHFYDREECSFSITSVGVHRNFILVTGSKRL
jgi:hypothetical protein